MKRIIILINCTLCFLLFSCNKYHESDIKSLNSFIIVNESIEKTNNNFSKNIELIYSEIEGEYFLNPNKYIELHDSAKKLQENTDKILDYINSIKYELISITEGISIEKAQKLNVKEMKNVKYDNTTKYFFGNKNDGSEGKAKLLKDKIIDYRIKILGLISPKFISLLDKNIGLRTDELYLTEEGNRQSWEMKYFNNSNAITTIIFLNSITNEILSAEVEIVNQLFLQVSD